MEKRQLGNTDLQVSLICLGTMTWGQQNSEAEAHEQMDYALSQGVNFFDTAEMYPVPPTADTQGRTEEYIGSWFAKNGNRDEVILATKVAGPAEWLSYVRGGPQLTEAHIREAIESSLKRLQTDYVDLYQIHWPARPTNFFGQLGYQHQEVESTPLEETLAVMQALIDEGKIRHYGLSNETPWGAMKAIQIADQNGWARPVSVQNPYNLLNRSYEVGMAEVSHREKMGLLAYSPLGFGVLSGKYLGGKRPENSRLTMFDRFVRYTGPLAQEATQMYADIAAEHNLSPAALALAFVNQQGFVTSNIIGATTMEQLKENIDTHNILLCDEVFDAINEVQGKIPNPCP